MTDSPIEPAAPAPSMDGSVSPLPETPLLKAAIKRHAKLAELLANAAAAQGLDDPEIVHDLRVAARRLSEVVRLLEDFLDKPTAKAVAGSLRSLRQTMGTLRDSDVMRNHLAKWRMPTPLKQAAADLELHLAAARPALAQSALQQLTAASLNGTMVLLAHLLEQKSQPLIVLKTERSLASHLQRLRKRRDNQLRAAFGKAALRQTADALHAARIAVKKLRYATELASASEKTRGHKSQLKFLKQMQELLGDHHDAHVIEQMLNTHLHAPRTPAQPANPALAAAWRKWRRETAREQSKRAALFFMRSYTWMNAP